METIRRDKVEAIARKVRKTYFATTSDPRQAFSFLFKALGGKLQYVVGNDSESLIVSEDGTFELTLPISSSAARDNFTIAHELGHYFLHHKNGSKEVFQRKGSGRQEWEANWFAAELLMPQKDFLEAAEELNNNVDRLAAKFGVSGAAAQVRLSSLAQQL